MDTRDTHKTQEALRASAERFRALVTASSNALYRMSPDWAEMLNLKGMDYITDAERPNRDWLRLYIPEDEQPRLLAAIQEAIKGKSPFELEHQVIERDGTLGWASSRAVPLLDSRLEIIEWIGAATNITDRKRAEEALHRREEELVWTQQVGGVASLDIKVSNGLIGYRSPEYLRLHGLTTASTNETYEEWLQGVHPDDRDSAQRTLDAALAGKRSTYDCIYRIIRPNDGEERWIHATADIERNAMGDAVRLIGAHIDITERKWAEALERAVEAQQAFLLQLSDELRNVSDPNDMKEVAARVLGQHLKLSCVGYAELGPDGDTIFISGEYRDGRMPANKGWYRMSDFGIGFGHNLHAGEKIFSEDVRADPRGPAGGSAMSQVFQVRAGAALPLIKGGRLVAYLYALHYEPHSWAESELQLMREVAERTWSAVERARAEAALRESEEKFRILSDMAPALIWFDDPEGNCLTFNQGYLDFTGKPSDEVTGTGWHLILHEDDADAYLTAFQTAINERRPFHHLVRAKRYDGQWRWLESYAKPLFATDGTFLGYVGISPDITDRVRAEQAWRKSEERLRLMVESVEDYAIFTMNNDGLIETWNIGAERLFGYREEEIIGEHGKIIFTPADRRRGIPANELRTAHAEGSAEDERWHIRKDGTRFYASGVLTALRESDVVTGYVKIARDLTEQKRAAEELRRAHEVLEEKVQERTNELAAANVLLRDEISERIQTEKERVGLLRQIVRAQEDERRRIARDIHDHLGQQMTALRLNLEMLDRGCRENEETRLILAQTKVIAERLDADVDFLAWELRPIALDDIGLVEALNNYVREWSKHSGVKAEFHAAGVEKERLSPETETNLYRITQEALNNTMKYARATQVAVMLERRGQQVSLIVEDNGIGFNLRKGVSGVRDKGMGLIGMRERTALVGGTLEIESKPKEGTTIFVRVPVEFPKGGGAS
jgi:PAS domain S-box-containing protein